jgi:mRNA-degrading endonuclease RelE of RelBE toxin-antitoxin system
VNIRFLNEAEKQFHNLDANTAGRIMKGILGIPGKGDIKPLKGEFSGKYRLRIGDWRIFFLISDDTIFIDRIEARGGAYK